MKKFAKDVIPGEIKLSYKQARLGTQKALLVHILPPTRHRSRRYATKQNKIPSGKHRS